jgi:uncharacterized membrane protein
MKIPSRFAQLCVALNSTLSGSMLLLVTVLISFVTTAFAVQGAAFISIDVPGAVSTGASSVNDAGVVVGHFATADGNLHGFTDFKGHFQTFDVTCGSSQFTDVAWINSRGQIVGTCGLLPGGLVAAYVKSGPAVSVITYPGAQITTGYGISDTGDVVGVEIGEDGIPHGYLLSNGQFSLIDFPGAVKSFATMTLRHGVIVGNYSNSLDEGTGSGFIWSGGRFSSINFHTAVLTWISGINERGELSGFYLDANSNQHGFIRRKNRFTTVDLPGAAFTQVVGINAEGDIVGSYVSSDGNAHGFLLLNQSAGQ